eukprot:Sspe_Gene.26121::Locus_10698_Transcript_1_1_Confidence_1.000_Length_976::g.26121::m.26121
MPNPSSSKSIPSGRCADASTYSSLMRFFTRYGCGSANSKWINGRWARDASALPLDAVLPPTTTSAPQPQPESLVLEWSDSSRGPRIPTPPHKKRFVPSPPRKSRRVPSEVWAPWKSGTAKFMKRQDDRPAELPKHQAPPAVRPPWGSCTRSLQVVRPEREKATRGPLPEMEAVFHNVLGWHDPLGLDRKRKVARRMDDEDEDRATSSGKWHPALDTTGSQIFWQRGRGRRGADSTVVSVKREPSVASEVKRRSSAAVKPPKCISDIDGLSSAIRTTASAIPLPYPCIEASPQLPRPPR